MPAIKAALTMQRTQFDRAIREFSHNTRADLKKETRRAMKILVRQLINVSAPPAFDKGGEESSIKDTKKKGELAVEKDIRKLFHGVFGVKRGTFKVDPAFHQSHRNSRGRVRGIPSDQKMIVGEANLDRYIRDVQKHVGRLKAGWLPAAERLKVSGIPKFVSRHSPGDGAFIDALDRSMGVGFIEAINRNKAVSRLTEEHRLINMALESTAIRLRKQMRHVVDYNTRKASAAA